MTTSTRKLPALAESGLRVTADEAVPKISKVLGELLSQTDSATLRVYDD